MSLVLFSLLLSLVILGQRLRYLYADNIALVVTGALLKESLKNVETEANTLVTEIRWLGLEVEPLKIEVMVYYGMRIESPVGGEMVIVGYTVKMSREVKYLGVVLDNKLSFKAYVVRRMVVGWGVARLIRNLLTKIELRTEAVVKIIKIVLVPSLVYRSKVWWKGSLDDKGEIKAWR